MNEDEVIKELAQPIIEKLKELELENKDELVEIPRIKFVGDFDDESLEINGIPITEEFIERLEAYVQEELDAMRIPTVLH